MKLVYESTLEDAAEPAVRQFLRSKTARKAKIRSTVTGAVCAATVVLIFFHDRPPLYCAVTTVIAAIFAGFINYISYTPTVVSRTRKYMERETGDKLPATTTYWFEDRKIHCEFLGSTISFPLSKLERVSEDKDRMEILFGCSRNCVIPLRAFTTPEQKAAFLENLNTKHLAPETT